MTLQSEWLLHQFRKVEKYEGQLIYVDCETKTISNVHDEGEPFNSVSFRWNDTEIQSIIQYLEDNGKLRTVGACGAYVELSHEGSHAVQIYLTWFANSILLPVLVSVVTTLVTLAITG